MEAADVRGPGFKVYGQVIEGRNVSGLMKAMEPVPLPEGAAYVASMPELEALPAARELADGTHGQTRIQAGYCNRHNRKLNAPEYRRNSEVSLTVKSLIPLLGKQQDTSEDFTYDIPKVKAFLVPAGTLIEVYAAILRYVPCRAGDEGLRCAVVLPQGTNMELDHRPVGRCGEEKLLAARNKWLIDHEEGDLDEDARIGLARENISLS